MFESAAIVRFIALYEGPHLLPNPSIHSLQVTADFEQMFAFASITMDGVLWQLRMLVDFRGNKREDSDVVDVWVQKWNNEIAPQLEQRLSNVQGEFVCPAIGFSLADIMLTHNLIWARNYVAMKLLDKYPAVVEAYTKRMASREALRHATTDRDLFEKDGNVRTLGKL